MHVFLLLESLFASSVNNSPGFRFILQTIHVVNMVFSSVFTCFVYT